MRRRHRLYENRILLHFLSCPSAERSETADDSHYYRKAHSVTYLRLTRSDQHIHGIYPANSVTYSRRTWYQPIDDIYLLNIAMKSSSCARWHSPELAKLEKARWQSRRSYVMLCYVMLCYVMLCYVMLCYVMLCYVMLCYVMLCYVMLCYVMLCYVMLCYVMLCYVMLCYVMLCYVMLCYVMLCYVRTSHFVSKQNNLMTTISTQALYNPYFNLQTTPQFPKQFHSLGCYVRTSHFVSNWGNAQCILVRWKRGSSQHRALWSAENEAPPQRKVLWSAEREAKTTAKSQIFLPFFYI